MSSPIDYKAVKYRAAGVLVGHIIGISRNNMTMTTQNAEEIVIALDSYIAAFLAENPELVRSIVMTDPVISSAIYRNMPFGGGSA